MDLIYLKSKIARLLKKTKTTRNQKGKAAEAKSFKENQQQEEAFDTRDLGTRMVPVDKIVGSVGRYHDFDDKFRLKDYVPHDRLENIKKAIRDGQRQRKWAMALSTLASWHSSLQKTRLKTYCIANRLILTKRPSYHTP
jgi:hypothetical protein